MSVKDTKEFHLSTSKELLAIRDRVRNLVDHWGEDGAYKEAILKTVIKRFLPKKYSIATGFVVRQTSNKSEHEPSKQINLIIYDDNYPTLFKEGDFAIVTPDSVKAIIEVKANLENQSSKNVIEKANESGKFIYEGKKTIDEYLQDNDSVQGSGNEIKLRRAFFNGVFSFEGYKNAGSGDLKTYLKNENDSFKSDQDFELYCVNHISFNEDIFYKYWQGFKYYNFSSDGNNAYIYNLGNLSFSYFISNLMEYLSDSINSNSNLWYPVNKNNDILEQFNF